MGPRFLTQFAGACRPGAYVRVLCEGDITALDPIEVTSRPTHGVTSALVVAALFGERHLLPMALTALEPPADLRAWMQERGS